MAEQAEGSCRLQGRWWSEADFTHGAAAWNDLLSRSQADRLFMSWEWARQWWLAFSNALGAKLRIFTVAGSDGRLLGLLPLYEHRCPAIPFRQTIRMEIMGNCWRRSGRGFGEYLEPLVDRDHADAALDVMADALWACDWDDLVVPNARPGAATGLCQRLSRQDVVLRETDPVTAWGVDLRGGFDGYLRGLSANTRRRAFNQRRKQEDLRWVAASPGDVQDWLTHLKIYKERRWGGATDPLEVDFDRRIVGRMQNSGELQLTGLFVGSQPVSIMLDIQRDDREYYLQSGFNDAYASGMSPGYLHLGFALEQAAQRGLEYFDFLAGRGKSRDYKVDLANSRQDLVTLHLIRDPVMRRLHRLRASLRGRTSKPDFPA